MLAVASIAVGVVASLTAPSANAASDEHRAAAAPGLGGVDSLTKGNQLGPLNTVTGTLGPVLGMLPH